MGNVAIHGYVEIESDELDLERFSLAWQRVVERHDMLRAIVLANGQQQILENVPAYKIEVLDLRSLDPEVAGEQLEAIRDRLSHQVLPLIAGRCSRFALPKLRGATSVSTSALTPCA